MGTAHKPYALCPAFYSVVIRSSLLISPYMPKEIPQELSQNSSQSIDTVVRGMAHSSLLPFTHTS